VSWVIVVLGFMVLIVLHELGHFTVAKLVGMRVEKFSLFFPPTIWSTKRGETEYAIGAIPAGGYVRISGMNPSEDLPDEVRDRAYHAQPVWKRMAVIAAGPIVNFILAFVLLLFAFAVFGPRIASTSVDATAPGSPASKVLKHGDNLVAVDGKRPPASVKSDNRNIFFANLISAHKCAGGVQRQGCQAQTPATLTVRRGGKLLTFSVRPRYDTKNQPARMRVGFSYAFPRHAYSFGKAVDETASQFWFITRETVKIPSYIFNAKKRKQISGIVGTSDAANKAVSNDAADAIALFAVISLSLAIINLFPFLPLDGGHIFWAFVEWVRRRPVPYAVMERAGVVGFMLVIGLFLLGLTNDIDRLTSGTGVR
jgi:regulator of sigma E protease